MADTRPDPPPTDEVLPPLEPGPQGRAGWSRRQVGLLVAGSVAAVPAARLLGVGTWSTTSSVPPDGTVVTRGRGAPTTFGSVAVLRAERQPRLAVGAPHVGHHDGPDPVSPEPGNHTWADRVALDVEVHNGTDLPVLLSAGQVRLRIGPDGQTVTPESSDRPVEGLAAGSTERLTITYFAPAGVDELAVEFTDPHLGEVLLLDLPPLQWRPAPS